MLIDSMGPLHPDYATHQISTDGLSEMDYFRSLCVFLDRFEHATGSRVSIAAHPRAAKGLLEDRYGNRTIFYDQTIRCIALADVVLLTLASTAVGAAVSFTRPIIGVALPSVSKLHQLHLTNLSSLLDFPIYPAEYDFDTEPRLSVHLEAYARYMSAYVKRSGTPMVAFWEAVASDAQSVIESKRGQLQW